MTRRSRVIAGQGAGARCQGVEVIAGQGAGVGVEMTMSEPVGYRGG